MSHNLMKLLGLISDKPAQIESSNISIGDQIGKGHFGEVYKVIFF